MKNLATIAILIIGLSVHGQTTITGRVIDASSGDPLPYVAIRGIGGGLISCFIYGVSIS